MGKIAFLCLCLFLVAPVYADNTFQVLGNNNVIENVHVGDTVVVNNIVINNFQKVNSVINSGFLDLNQEPAGTDVFFLPSANEMFIHRPNGDLIKMDCYTGNRSYVGSTNIYSKVMPKLGNNVGNSCPNSH